MDKLNAMKPLCEWPNWAVYRPPLADLRLTQPAVSQQIASLEQQLGAQLLFRSTRRSR